jgi:hypothetical protein
MISGVLCILQTDLLTGIPLLSQSAPDLQGRIPIGSCPFVPETAAQIAVTRSSVDNRRD